jgi:hypothetical protein
MGPESKAVQPLSGSAVPDQIGEKTFFLISLNSLAKGIAVAYLCNDNNQQNFYIP